MQETLIRIFNLRFIRRANVYEKRENHPISKEIISFFMRFSNNIIDIPAETKIRLWRFNKGKHSPFMTGDPWNLTAKSVYDDTGAGIYGVWDENITLCGNVTPFQAFAIEAGASPELFQLIASTYFKK